MFFYKTKEKFSNNEQKTVLSRINSKHRRRGGIIRSKNIEGKISELFMYGLQKIRGKFKLAYSVFAVAIFMGAFSVSSFAICNINNPQWNADATPEAKYEYNYVYFGNVTDGLEYSNNDTNTDKSKSYVADTRSGHSYQEDNKTKAPIKFRVLNTTANDGETPALFMLTEYAIGERRWDTGASGTQVWGTSEIRRWLNGYKANNEKPSEGESAAYDNSVLPTCFSEEEQAAIMETTTHEAGEALYWYKNSNGNRWAGRYEDSKVDGIANQQVPLKSNQLEGDKIFLLSAEEVTNPEYGFVNNKNESVSSGSVYAGHASRVCAQANATGSDVWWWLRSAFSDDPYDVANVRSMGASGAYYSSNPEGAVRFGLNVPLSFLIYASKAGINLASGASPSTFKSMDRIAPSGDNPEYKLTILDKYTPEKQSFTTDKNSIITGVGNAIKINYSGAVYSTSAHECISAVIRDITSGDTLYYVYLKRCTTAQDESGELTIDIPDNLEPGSYKLMVMNERICGEYQTSSASVSDITLNIVENYPLACDIKKPVYAQAGSTYDYVYFGEADSEKVYENIGATNDQSQYVVEGQSATVKKAPIKFRVLDTTSNGYAKDDTNKKRVPALFMLAEYAIGQRRWDTGVNLGTEPKHSTQDWYQSEMRAWLNGEAPYNINEANSVLLTCFGDKEQSAIMGTTTNEGLPNQKWYSEGLTATQNSDNSSMWTDMYNNLRGEKIFLLSAKEVLNINYGFSDNYIYSNSPKETSRICYLASVDKTTGTGNMWYLRSGGSHTTNRITYINEMGRPSMMSSNINHLVVRFALNIPLCNIVYSSPATSTIISPGFVKIPTISPDESKLTILDSNRSNFSATSSVVTALIGGSINIGYNGATYGENEYISAIIQDTNTGDALYYGYFDQCESSSGTISMSLPDDIGLGTYKLILMNEKRNGDKLTNYAGCFEVELTVYDGEAPLVINVYTNASNTNFRLTASDNVELSRITKEDGTIIDDTIEGLNNVTKNIQSSRTNVLKVYDSSDNEVLVEDMIIDRRGPKVESITYDAGNYTIRVSDTQSGIWKITNATGDVIYERYDGITISS